MTVYEDEFDLYPYVLTLLKNWKLIVFLGLLAGAAALIFSLLQSRTYSATATLIGTYRRPVLNLSEEYSTVASSGDINSKKLAFMTIARSDAMASSVFEQYADQLPADMNLTDFKEHIEVSDQGDAILITASFEDPELSAAIANTWAEATVTAINVAYGDAQPLGPIQDQIISSRADYLAAQDALETFVKDNQIADLERSISESQKVLTILQSAQLDIIDKYLSTQVDLITQQADEYFYALSEHTDTIFSTQVDEQLALYSYYATRQTQLETFLTQAEALKAQLSDGTRSVAGNSGDALALFLTRAQTFGFESEQPLDIMLTDITNLQDETSNYVADINRIIEQIQAELEKNAVKLQELSTLLAKGGDYQYYETPDTENPLFQAGVQSLDQLVQMKLPASLVPDYSGSPLQNQIEETSVTIQSLQAQLEREKATQNDLTNERDLAEKAYQALLVQETQIKAGSQSSNEVALASAAVENATPDPRGTVTNTLLAGIVGGLLAVVWVFVSTWWKNQSADEAENAATA